MASAIHPVSLPSLRNQGLRRIERFLLNRPGNPGTLAQWAAKLDIAPRVHQAASQGTGLSFQTWRDQIRTFVAISLLNEGRPLAEIADVLGYDAAWAFTAMFKQVTGRVPSPYGRN